MALEDDLRRISHKISGARKTLNRELERLRELDQELTNLIEDTESGAAALDDCLSNIKDTIEYINFSME